MRRGDRKKACTGISKSWVRKSIKKEYPRKKVWKVSSTPRSQGDQGNNGNQNSKEGTIQDSLVLRRSSVFVARSRSLAALAESGGTARAVRGAGTGAAATAMGVARLVSRATIARGNSVGAAAGLVRRSRSGRAGANVHVKSSSAKGGEHGFVVGDLDGAFEAGFVLEDVCLGALDIRATGRVVAFDGDFAKGGVVVTGVLDVLAIPVDLTAGPGNGTRGVAGLTSGPQGQLHSGGRLRVHVLFAGLVVGGFLFKSSLHLTINRPGDGVGFPVNGVLVPVAKGVTT